METLLFSMVMLNIAMLLWIMVTENRVKRLEHKYARQKHRCETHHFTDLNANEYTQHKG